MLVGIVGATASGKSGLALDYARSLSTGRGGQIISMDAFALYRGMDIGTAKPSVFERQEVIHHQIDVLDIHEEASVARYQQEARANVSEIQREGQQAIAVGGSALYVRALFDDIRFPGTSPDIRAQVEARLEEVGSAALYRELVRLDPVAAEAIHPNNSRRVVRALEVIELTGQPFSASLPQPRFVRPSILVGVKRDLADLDERISQRTARMLEDGFVDEVQTLMDAGLADTKTAAKATGYQPVMDYINGLISLGEVEEQICLQTRQLVRKQMKWFRRDSRIHWIDAADKTSGELLADLQNLLNQYTF